MSIRVTVGRAQALESRQAGAQAARQAFEALDRAPVVFGWVIANHRYSMPQVLLGVSSIIGDTPLIGFSTVGEATNVGWSQRAVVVALMGGPNIRAQAEWSARFGEDSQGSVQQLLEILDFFNDPPVILMAVADGMVGDISALLWREELRNIPVVGCLSSGDPRYDQTSQMGGRHAGNSGLALAGIQGLVVSGVGAGHGWFPVGASYHMTRVREKNICELNGLRPSETYASLFGFSEQEWKKAPLNTLVRLYPLGVDRENSLHVASPLRIEADGSLRMGIEFDEHTEAHILVGNPDQCLETARLAAMQALKELDGARPIFAWLLVDVAWQMLFQDRAGAEIRAILEVLGADIPLAGGYTLGQLAPPLPGVPTQLLNQHLVLVVFGE